MRTAAREKTRVVIFIYSMSQGGAERQMSELVRQLAAGPYEVHLVLCHATNQLGYDLPVASLHSLEARSFPTVRAVRRLQSIVRALQPDVLHSFMGLQNAAARWVGHRLGVPAVVASVRCTELPWSHVVGERLTERLGHCTIVNSVGIRDELIRRAGADAARIEVVENGVDTQRFRPRSQEERQALRSELGWSLDAPVLLLPGRLSPQKNQLALVQALTAGRQEGWLPVGTKVLLAGRASPGPYAPRVLAALEAEPAAAAIGVVSDIERYLAAADAVILPSRYEGLPNAVLEAMASGTPAIVSPPANTDSLIRDGQEGIVLEGVEAPAIAAGLRRFFASSPAKWREMGAAGRLHVEQRFSLSRMAQATTAVYERLLDVGE